MLALLVRAYPHLLPTLLVTAAVLLTYACAHTTHDTEPEHP